MSKHADFAIRLTAAPYAWHMPDGEAHTTFWNDFQIANAFGKKAVQDTFDRAFYEWRDDVEYLIELVFTLNYMAWDFVHKDDEMCELYCSLYEQANSWAYDNLHGSDLSLYYQITD